MRSAAAFDVVDFLFFFFLSLSFFFFCFFTRSRPFSTVPRGVLFYLFIFCAFITSDSELIIIIISPAERERETGTHKEPPSRGDFWSINTTRGARLLIRKNKKKEKNLNNNRRRGLYTAPQPRRRWKNEKMFIFFFVAFLSCASIDAASTPCE